jgi:hypothetical protein
MYESDFGNFKKINKRKHGAVEGRNCHTEYHSDVEVENDTSQSFHV